MITGKFVRDFEDDFFEDIDLTCLTFLSSINIDARHNVYQYLYTTFYNYELVYEPTLLKRFIEDKIWENADMLNHLYETTQYEYNPIWNKDGTITETRTIENSDESTITGTESRSSQKATTLGGTKVIDRDTTDGGTITNVTDSTEETKRTGTDTVAETGTDTTTQTGTDTVLHTGTDNTSTSQSGTSKGSDYPMNVSSGTGKPRQYQETSTSGSNNNTKNLSDAETKNLTDTETKNLTTQSTKNLTDTVDTDGSVTETRALTGSEDIRETNQETGSETGSESGTSSQTKTGEGTTTENYERVEQGNIGVTSTQQLIKEEREIILVMYTKIVSLISDFFYLNMMGW